MYDIPDSQIPKVAAIGLDVINTLALESNTDSKHHIYYKHGENICSLTLAELDAQAINVASHLYELGVRQGDRIGIMARNQIEWVLLDLAIIKLGAVTAGFEPGRFEAHKIIHAYNLKYLFINENMPQEVIFNLEQVADWANSSQKHHLPFHDGYDLSDICAIKFTSGSTGLPKGLEATVGSINSSLAAVQDIFAHGDGDNILIFLRLSLLQQRYWLYSALINRHDVTLSDMNEVLPMSQATSPTVIMGVPGFYADLKTKLETSSLAFDFKSRCSAIQALLGGRIRYLWTGSAPASPSVLSFFNESGVPLYEGYGLNETCIVAKNYPGSFRIGSVGKVLPNKTIRFDREGILIVGSHYPVNCRYTWCTPGTSEKIFLPTGEVKTYDIGYVDDDGFLYIQGRVDDIITLNSGRNVLVRLVEEKLCEHHSVHTCVLFGNGKPFISAIISLAADNLDIESLVTYVTNLNSTLFVEQRVQALILSKEQFSLENGLLTSQFKPKRQDIYRYYSENLVEVYTPHGCINNSIVKPLITIIHELRTT